MHETLGGAASSGRSDRPELTVLPGQAPAEHGLRTSSEEMWQAWRRLEHFEDSAAQLGDVLAPELIVLWAVWRFGNSDPGDTLLGELIDDDMMPRFRDPLVEDMMLVAFALGAGWGAALDAAAPAWQAARRASSPVNGPERRRAQPVM